MLNEWNSKVKHEVSLFSKNDLTPRGGGMCIVTVVVRDRGGC